jgi:cephalosporin hydroxylase
MATVVAQPKPVSFLASNLNRPAECSSQTSVKTEAVEELVLHAQRGIEEAEEARGTDMTLHPKANKWGIPMANSTMLINGKTLTFDDILYGYDLMFENLAMFSRTSWFGVSVQQDPSDAFALSSLLWREQPDLLVEIGTNTGGGAILYATVMREYNPKSLVLTIDPKDPAKDWARVNKGCPECVDVRCSSIWHSHVEFVLGKSRDPAVLARVQELAKQYRKVAIMHDGSHFYEDVLEDLKAYDSFTPVGSYMVVQDTKMTRMYKPLNGNGFPLDAARDFMHGQGNGRYVVDKQYEFLLSSQHHDGFLRKVRA